MAHKSVNKTTGKVPVQALLLQLYWRNSHAILQAWCMQLSISMVPDLMQVAHYASETTTLCSCVSHIVNTLLDVKSTLLCFRLWGSAMGIRNTTQYQERSLQKEGCCFIGMVPGLMHAAYKRISNARLCTCALLTHQYSRTSPNPQIARHTRTCGFCKWAALSVHWPKDPMTTVTHCHNIINVDSGQANTTHSPPAFTCLMSGTCHTPVTVAQ